MWRVRADCLGPCGHCTNKATPKARLPWKTGHQMCFQVPPKGQDLVPFSLVKGSQANVRIMVTLHLLLQLSPPGGWFAVSADI